MPSIDDIAAEYVERAAALDPCYATYAGIAGHDQRAGRISVLTASPQRAGAGSLHPRRPLTRPKPRSRAQQVARAAMRERLALAVECYDAGDTASELNTISSSVQRVRRGLRPDADRLRRRGQRAGEADGRGAGRAGRVLAESGVRRRPRPGWPLFGRSRSARSRPTPTPEMVTSRASSPGSRRRSTPTAAVGPS